MTSRVLPLLLLAGCHAGYLTPVDAPEVEDTAPVIDSELVSTWVGSCEISEVVRPATDDAVDGISIQVALEVTGEREDCWTHWHDGSTCYRVVAPTVNADWPGSGEGQLTLEGNGPIDIYIDVEAEGYCDPSSHSCVPGWELYLWGNVQDGVYQGDCQSLSSGSYGNYPVTWGSGAFALETSER